MNLNFPNKLIVIRLLISLVICTLLISTYYVYGNPTISEIYSLDTKTSKIVFSINIISLFLFLIASFTDYLDGHLARKNNQVTNFGKLLDPLADKILINSILIIFAWNLRIPISFAILFIIRDLYVDGLRMLYSSKGKVISADFSGKLKTVFQIIGLSLIFLIYNVPLNSFFNWNSLYTLTIIPLSIALIISIYSAIDYSIKYLPEILKNEEK